MSTTTVKLTDLNNTATVAGTSTQVKILDTGGSNELEVIAGTAIAIADNLAGVHDPAIGLSTNAAVTGDNAATAIGHLRGINKQIAAGINSTIVGTAVISSGAVNATIVGTAVISAGTVNATIVGTASITGTPTINITQINGTAIASGNGVASGGVQRVAIVSDQTQLTNKLLVTPDANSTVNATMFNGTAVSVNNGTANTGTLRVAIASDNTANSNPFLVSIVPSAAQGWSKIRYAANGTSVQTVKGTAGEFGGYYVYNPNSSVAYLQIFDVATATAVTPGGTTPDLSYGIPATSAANLEFSNGINMVNGIKLLCATTSTGGTNVSTGLDLNIYYK